MALLFGVVGSVCAALACYSISRSRQVARGSAETTNLGTAYVSSPALVIYALASCATTVALLL